MTGTFASDDEIITLSHVTPKTGQKDHFVEIQTQFQQSVAPEIDGLIGGRFYAAEDGKSFVIMSRFRSRQDLENWTGSERFAAHMVYVRPLLEAAKPDRFTVLYQSGIV